ncbi:uncharacterized protein LOC111832121 [Capsella rubella]|uniref:uncharacterized protein LOC111832121 n=1 Tax=Capsella rubella TaxID=81985 RepID=UPI000CD579EE|nr:uncharacterized protein LOC111832121 [Capsella rubella]
MSPPKQPNQPIEDTIPEQFGPHPPSMIKEDDLIGVRFLCGLPDTSKILAPTSEQSPEDPPEGYCSNLERGSLSRTFADYFINFCGGQTAWDSFPSHQVWESGARETTSEPPTPASSQVGKDASEIPKKRKAPDSTPISRETSRLRTGDSAKRPEASSLRKRAEVSPKGANPYPPPTGQKGEPHHELPAPPKSLADMMRSFSRPGARTLIEFNSAVASYEHQLLSNPDANVVKELPNHLEVEKAKKFGSRLKSLESDLKIAEASLEDAQDKQKKAVDLYLEAVEVEKSARREVDELRLRNHAMEVKFRAEIKKALREERRETRAQLREAAEGVHVFLSDHNRLVLATIRAAEITANRMLVEEIEAGEIADLQAELETPRKDEIEAI